MADIFDEIKPDIFDEVAPATPGTAYNPTPEPAVAFNTESILREAPAFLGSNLAMLGKAWQSRIPLAAFGAAGAEGYHQAYQAITGDPEAPLSMMDSAKRMAAKAGAYGIGQGVGEGTIGILAKAWPHVKSQFVLPGLEGPEAEMRVYMEPYLSQVGAKGRSERTMDWIRDKLPSALQWEQYPKPGFTLAQKADPLSGIARAENIVESSLTGKSPLSKFKWAQEKGLQDWGDKLTTDIWAGVQRVPPSEQGKVFAEGFQIAEKKFTEESKALYSQVDEALSNKTHTVSWPESMPSFTINRKYFVDISSIKKDAKLLAQKNEQFNGIGSSEAGDNLIKQISELPERELSFAEAAELRSRLLKQASQLEGKDVATGWAKTFAKKVDSIMEEAAGSVSPEAQKLWRAANKFYKEGKETFSNDFIRSLAKKGEDQPELVGKAIFQNGEITQVKAAKEVLKENPEAWQNLKAGYLEGLIENAKSISTDPTLIGKTLSRKLKGMGSETLRETFTTPELLMIQNFEKAALATQSKPPGSGGSMLVQLLQAGAAGSAITGAYFKDPEMAIPGIAILASPRILARMMINPKWHSLFMQGLSTDKARAIPAITKLAAGAVEIERQYLEKENERKALNANIQEQAQYR